MGEQNQALEKEIHEKKRDMHEWVVLNFRLHNVLPKMQEENSKKEEVVGDVTEQMLGNQNNMRWIVKQLWELYEKDTASLLN